MMKIRGIISTVRQRQNSYWQTMDGFLNHTAGIIPGTRDQVKTMVSAHHSFIQNASSGCLPHPQNLKAIKGISRHQHSLYCNSGAIKNRHIITSYRRDLAE